MPAAKLASEQLLESMIVREPCILSSEWMLIGQQEVTSHGGRIDLLAIAPDGSLVLIELKRDRTPREIVAQALDYASWVVDLTADRIVQIYQRFSKGGSLQADFQKRFGSVLDEDTLNHSHQIIIVASELDPSTERIVAYLNARDIAINVVFFKVFEHGGQQLLSRAWMIDPGETQANAAATNTAKGEAKEPWNGEFYVSFGDPSRRNWDDARKYGYICMATSAEVVALGTAKRSSFCHPVTACGCAFRKRVMWVWAKSLQPCSLSMTSQCPPLRATAQRWMCCSTVRCIAKPLTILKKPSTLYA